MCNVDHPEHYQGNGMECIDVIEAFNLGFELGNAIKYILRAGHKGDMSQWEQDIKKAIWYLNRYIGKKDGTDRIDQADERRRP